jgi:glutamate 5-kinase
MTADPRLDPDAEVIPLIDTPEIEDSIWKAAGSEGELGVGGMITKLEAAELARRSGTTVVIANGDSPEVLLHISVGDAVGTRILPTVSAVESRKRYLLSGGEAGLIKVDSGAELALSRGGSLLPAGMLEISGQFDRGETVTVCSPEGREIAHGLVNYDNEDCAKLCGRQSSEIEPILGYFYGEEVIHRNNMILL